MPVERKDNSRNVLRRYENAAYKGVDAAANHLLTEVKKAFGSNYYLTGKYRNTLGVRRSIRKRLPKKTVSGYESVVGTKFIEALYWELGFTHAGNGKRYHVPLWVPTAVKEINAMRETFARTMSRYMGGS